MTDADEYSECLICEGKDCDGPEDLDRLCSACREEVIFLLGERRAGRY